MRMMTIFGPYLCHKSNSIKEMRGIMGGRHTVDRQMGECIILHNYDKWENHCRILTCGRMTCSPIFALFHLLVVMGQMGEWGLIILPFVTIKWQIESNGRMYGLSDEVENLLIISKTRSGPVAAIGRVDFFSNSMKWLTTQWNCWLQNHEKSSHSSFGDDHWNHCFSFKVTAWSKIHGWRACGPTSWTWGPWFWRTPCWVGISFSLLA